MGRTKKVDMEAQVTHSEEIVQEGAEQAPVESAEEVQETELAESQEEEDEEDSIVDEEELTEGGTEPQAKEEYVEYCLPFLPGVDVGDSQTVTVNGKNYQVQYGVPMKMPVGVKEILEEMVEQSRRVKDKIDRLSREEKCIAKFD